MDQTGHLSLRFIVYSESKSLSHIWLFATPWIVAHQAPLSMDFTGKNTGVFAIPFSGESSWPRDWIQFSCISGRFVIIWATREAQSESHTVVSNSLRPHGLYSPWNSPGQNTTVGNLSLLQGIFPTHGSNPGLLRCRQILYHLSHKGSPRILKWVAYPFSSGSSQPRNQTRVSCIAGRFFTNWAIREAQTSLESREWARLDIYHLNSLYIGNT